MQTKPPAEILQWHGRHWPFTTPESKREMARSLEEAGDSSAIHWEALAEMQERDLLEEFHAARAAWKKLEPRAADWLKEHDAHAD